MGEHPKEYPKVFQLYLWKDKGLNRALLQKAREHGYDAVALTADFTWFGNRERDTRNGFSVPPNYSVRQIVEAIKRPAWTWDLLVNDVYTYANIDKNVPAESMAAFINKQLCPDFNWKDASGSPTSGGVTSPSRVWSARTMPSRRSTTALTPSGSPTTAGASWRPPFRPSTCCPPSAPRSARTWRSSLTGASCAGRTSPRPSPWALMLWAWARPTCTASPPVKPGVRKAIDTLHVELERAMGLLGTRTVEELKARGPGLIKKRQTSEWPPKDYVFPKFEEDKGPGKIAIEEAA